MNLEWGRRVEKMPRRWRLAYLAAAAFAGAASGPVELRLHSSLPAAAALSTATAAAAAAPTQPAQTGSH